MGCFPQAPRGIDERERKDIEFERKQARKVKQCVKVSEENISESVGSGRP